MEKLLLKLILITLFVSCGKDGAFVTDKKIIYTVKPATAEKYEYELRIDGCTTEIQTFDTFLEVCQGLKDEELNNSCAQDGREELFEKSACPGDFLTT